MNTLQFKIVTPEGTTYENDVEQISLPTVKGEITVLPHHIPLVAVLAPGEIRVVNKGATLGFAVSGGVVEIRPQSEVYIIADTAERAEHIDIERAEAARKRAEELMKEQHNLEDIQFVQLQAKIQKELARVRVARKYRNINQ